MKGVSSLIAMLALLIVFMGILTAIEYAELQRQNVTNQYVNAYQCEKAKVLEDLYIVGKCYGCICIINVGKVKSTIVGILAICCGKVPLYLKYYATLDPGQKTQVNVTYLVVTQYGSQYLSKITCYLVVTGLGNVFYA
jgi:hypothetical protein